MASNVQIRQVTCDWQSNPPTLTVNVLKTSSEGDVSSEIFTLNGPTVQNLISQVGNAIVTGAQAKYGARPVSLFTPPPSGD